METSYDFSKLNESNRYDLSKYIMDYSSEICDPIPILKQYDKLLISRGNLSVISGAPKSRKSMFVAVLIASFFGNINFGLTSYVTNGKVILFDTESSKSHTLKQIKRIYKMVGWTNTNSNLIVFHLRECSIDERIGIIVQAIEFYKPDWIVIDGLLDLIKSVNDDKETNLLVLELMKITSVFDCHITNIIHTGKSNGGQMLGWIGSYAQRKAETVFSLIKEGDDTKVIPAETRNEPFSEFSFSINHDGIPEFNGLIEMMTKSEIIEYNQKKNFTKLLAPDRSLFYDALVRDYMELTGLAERTAKGHIANMLKIGFIKKNGKGYKLTGIDSATV